MVRDEVLGTTLRLQPSESALMAGRPYTSGSCQLSTRSLDLNFQPCGIIRSE